MDTQFRSAAAGFLGALAGVALALLVNPAAIDFSRISSKRRKTAQRLICVCIICCAFASAFVSNDSADWPSALATDSTEWWCATTSLVLMFLGAVMIADRV